MTRQPSWATIGALAALLGVGCAPNENRVDLEVYDDPQFGPSGFYCMDPKLPPPRLLAQRALDEGSVRLVLDFAQLEGFAGCRRAELKASCARQSCQADLKRRVVADFPIDTSALPSGDSAATLRAVFRQFKRAGKLAVEDAPDGTVLVRLVATIDDPANLKTKVAFDEDKLVGCAHSCPVVLDELHGALWLGLDTLGQACATGVFYCANQLGQDELTNVGAGGAGGSN